MSEGIEGGLRRLSEALTDRHPKDTARVVEKSRVEVGAQWISQQTPRRAVSVLGKLTAENAEQMFRQLAPGTCGPMLELMNPQLAASLLARLDERERKERLAAIEPRLATDLTSLIEFPANSAGRLMDPRVVTFRPEDTVRDVIQKVRSLKRRRIQDVFLVDGNAVLVGAIPIQTVFLADGGQTLRSLVDGPPASVPATSSRAAVLETLQEHRVATLPVVDFENRLVGVLRQDELLATTAESASARMAKMVGAGQDERALSSPLFAVRKRLPWLEINLLTAFLAASVVGIFEETIAKFTALAVLLPVVAGQSGNTGAQALAVTMRGLALREIRVRHWWQVAGKELIAGFLNGVAVALTTAAAVYIWSRSLGLSLVICVSMIISMTAAGFAGAVIPMILTSLRQDPAQSSSIILTTVTDVAGFFSFLGIATLLMSML